ncbi:putative transcriptional regulator [Desulfosporosinus acidiphilus SJ4]|uniref:Putative transcriptional regulator n=1 Tax=Desulfosporosinus acidiphilus (strain DSM 22704 / JCM 16185 / SJ4) TaxID=646529 RepID=I4DBP8_DESAJ|nr:GntR family transcriptional regulator [Desulfosporosinus acidiphilus]AFM43222.1 putative transcriptional regulator [Desulfosporosinus acidiphilus SJ4]
MDLDRKSGVPYYIQLKEQIRRNITQGVWAAGTKLPTERELAGSLSVSRNTVSQAYKELESEGILSSAQGRGTFVADTLLIMQQEGRKEKVLRIIDVAMEEAVGLGFTIDDFVSFVHVRGMEKKHLLSRVKVAFVECNPEQLNEANWNLGPGVTLLPFLLSELHDSLLAQKRLAGMDMLVTGAAHLSEIKRLFEKVSLPILGVTLQPKLETIVRIAKLTAGRDLALVCESIQFAEKVKNALNQAGLHPVFKTLVQPDEMKLREILPDCGAVIYAPKLRLRVEKMLPENMECIEFRFEPDAGSLNLLRGALLEIKEGKS